MTAERGDARGVRGRPASPVRVKFATKVDPLVLTGLREVAKRQGARLCDVVELALQRYLQEDTANRTDNQLAPLVDQAILTRHKSLEGGLRRMIARLAFETLTTQYILLNFIVEANVQPSKVEKWRTDGRKYAIQEYRRRRAEFEEDPEEADA